MAETRLVHKDLNNDATKVVLGCVTIGLDASVVGLRREDCVCQTRERGREGTSGLLTAGEALAEVLVLELFLSVTTHR